MKWVSGHRYNTFEREDGSVYHAGLSHLCNDCGATIVTVPEDCLEPAHECHIEEEEEVGQNR